MTGIICFDPTSPATAPLALVLAVSGAGRGEAQKGTMPALKVNDRSYGASSGYSALLRYAAKSGGFYGKTPVDNLIVDDALALLSVKKPDFALIDSLFSDNSGAYLLGSELSIADLVLVCMQSREINKYENLKTAKTAAEKDNRVAPHIGSA